MYDGPIPFDKRGRLVRYYGGSTKGKYMELDSEYNWEDNFEFYATLTFLHFERGRSSVNAIYRIDHTSALVPGVGAELPMFLTDFEELVVNDYPPLHLTGNFEYVKRGSNYAVRMLIGSP